MSAQQPEALRLADWAEVQANREANEEEDNLNAISAELRRLHAEVEKLRAMLSAAPTPDVGINGLTEAETSDSASVMGLTGESLQWSAEEVDAMRAQGNPPLKINMLLLPVLDAESLRMRGVMQKLGQKGEL